MTAPEALLHHVERTLRREFELSIEPDDDGDYGIATEGIVVWIRPFQDSDPATVRIWTIAATDVKPTAGLLREVNDVNASVEQIKCVVASNRAVIVASEIEIESLQPGQLRRLVHEVGKTGVRVGELVATVFGGERPFTDDDVEPSDLG